MSYLSEEKKWLLHFVLSVTGTINFFNFIFQVNADKTNSKQFIFYILAIL